jgi:hypothetical protein
MNEDITFSNMDSWRGSSSGKYGLTFKQICLMHINRTVVNGSVEFRGGYQKEIPHGNFSTYEYIPDTRDVYSNSVRMLRALLLGYFDKQTKEADEKLEEEFNEKYKEYSEREEKGKDIKYEWYSYKVEWHIRLFEQLILLSKKLNFFEEETSEEEQ